MMNESVWTPSLKFCDVIKKVEDVRSSFEILRKFPIDIDAFLEFDLGIDIIPFSGLKERIGAEAMISKDYSSIYVDSSAYTDETQWSRLKFSIAHELGHFYLHKDFFIKRGIKTESDWISMMLEIKLKYVFLEHHANWFAGALLVPGEKLADVVKNKKCSSLSELTRYFGVSQSVIKKRFESFDVQNLLSEKDV